MGVSGSGSGRSQEEGDDDVGHSSCSSSIVSQYNDLDSTVLREED